MQQQQLYRAIYAYQGEDHQFTLSVGDLVTCEQQNNGWWGGTNMRTNRKGWYPSSYVEPVVVATTTNSSSSPLFPTTSHLSPAAANTPSANKDPGWAAHDESTIPTVHAVPVPSPPTWSSVQVAGQQREGPPSWSAQQPSVPSPAAVSSFSRGSSSSGSDAVSSVGQWLKNGIAHSSIGTNGPQQPPVHQQTVTVQETQVQRSGSWYFGPSSATTTTTVVSKQTTTAQLPSQTGVGRTAKKVGDTALMSAVWGATTLHPKQMLSAAAVAVAAYGVEGNQRAKAEQQQEEYMQEQRALAERARIEADQRRKEEEERRKASSWFKW